MPTPIRRTALLAVLALATGVSCKDLSVTSPPVDSVTIVPDGATLVVGETVLFVATLRDADGHELRRTVAWSTSAPSVVIVSNDGRVTAAGPGSATITAAAGGRSARADVIVNARPVTTVEVTPLASSLQIGDSVQFQATAKTADGEVVPGKVAVWSSSDPGIAQVRANGWARALAVGTTDILATIDGVRGEATLSVRAAVVAVSSVTIVPANTILAAGDTITLVARVTAADGSLITGRSPTWSSSNPGVAAVRDDGRVTAISAGTATIRATVDGVTGEAIVGVSGRGVATIDISPASVTLAVGTTTTLDATARSANGTIIAGVVVSWSSSDTTVATVSATGEVTAKAPGTVTITASADGRSATATILVVTQGVSRITLVPATPTIFAGDTLLLTAVLQAANGDTLVNRRVTWEVDGSGRAVVQATGPTTQQAIVIGVATGTTLIRASTEGVTDTISAMIAARADIAVSKSAPAPVVKVADTVDFSLVVRNNGPSPATGVVVRDTLPANGTFIAASGGPARAGRLLTWPTIDSLGVNASVAFTIRVIAPSSGGLTNIGAATTRTFERDLANNRATAAVTVNPPNLVVRKSASATTVAAGANITYTIEITNDGAGPAALVQVVDSLPVGVTFVSASNGGTLSGTVVSWPRISSVDPGQVIVYSVSVTAPLTSGVVTNVARATSPSGDTAPADNRSAVSVTVNAVADLVVTKTASVNVIGPAEVIGYTITVRNAGPSPALNVVITDQLPAPPATVVVPSISPPGTIDTQANVLRWDAIPSLAPGASAVFTLSVTAGPSGTVVNGVSVTSSTNDPDPASNTATVSTSVRSADLQMAMSGPASVNAASTMSWSLVVTNAGPDTALAVTVLDSLPAGATFIAASPPPASSGGRTVVWNVPRMVPGEVLTFGVDATAPANGPSAVNVARVTALTGDGTPSNNRSVATTTIVPVANLGVTKAGPPTAKPGDTITWSVSVSNAGPSTAVGATLTDNLPAGLTFVSANPTAVVNGQTVTWAVPDMAANGNAPFSLRAVVDPAAAAGSVTNTAVVAVASPTIDPDANNNSASFQTNIGITDVAVSIAGPTTALQTDALRYLVTVGNTGGVAASDVVVSYTLPAGANFVDANPSATPNGGVLTWNLGVLNGGQQVLLTVDLSSSIASGTLVNSVAATTSSSDANTSNNSASLTTTVSPAADLAIAMSAAPNLVNAGETVTYTMTVTNAGPSAAQDVQVNVTVPSVGTFVDATGGATPNGQNLQFGAFDLPAGEDMVLVYRWQAPAAGSLSSSAVVSSVTADPVPSNNSASAAPAIAAADLSISIAAPAAVAGAANFDYTITVMNGGPARAQDMVVTSPIPAGASFVGAAPAPVSQGPLTWNVAQLDPGANATFVVTLKAPLVGDVSMTASVSAATTDPAPANNTVTPPVVTTVNPLAADLVITVTPADTVVDGGTPFTYTIGLTNQGPGPAVDVTITGSTNGSNMTGLPSVPYALILAGQSIAPFQVTVTAKASGMLNTTFTATALTPDPNGASETVRTTVR